MIHDARLSLLQWSCCGSKQYRLWCGLNSNLLFRAVNAHIAGRDSQKSDCHTILCRAQFCMAFVTRSARLELGLPLRNIMPPMSRTTSQRLSVPLWLFWSSGGSPSNLLIVDLGWTASSKLVTATSWSRSDLKQNACATRAEGRLDSLLVHADRLHSYHSQTFRSSPD